MFVHLHAFLCQCSHKVLFRSAMQVGGSSGENVPHPHQFFVGNADFVAAHPSLRDGNGFGRTEVDHHPVVIGRHQLPCAPHQVQTDHPPLVVSLRKRFVRRFPGTHRNCPSHHAVLLRLHGAHVSDQLSWVVILRCNKLLVEKAYCYWIHDGAFFTS